jgi:hypothetical protein
MDGLKRTSLLCNQPRSGSEIKTLAYISRGCYSVLPSQGYRTLQDRLQINMEQWLNDSKRKSLFLCRFGHHHSHKKSRGVGIVGPRKEPAFNRHSYVTPLWSSGQSSWLQIQRSRVPFPVLPDFLRSSGSGTGSTQPREDN